MRARGYRPWLLTSAPLGLDPPYPSSAPKGRPVIARGGSPWQLTGNNRAERHSSFTFSVTFFAARSTMTSIIVPGFVEASASM
jgi:hypothetical protein